MASLWRRLLQVFNSGSTVLAKSSAPDLSTFAVGDRVIIEARKTFLSSPLQPGQTTQLPQGYIAHNDIIGRAPLDRIQTHKGLLCKVTFPTLEQYVTFTPRKVTPVYSADANLIVSLLDIHTILPTSKVTEPLEILEAGTGHGSLTLHLARAIHGANPAPPYLPPPIPSGKDSTVPSHTGTESAWADWFGSRRAVLHTLDISANFSQHAQKLVRQFRRGIYSPHVDFHVAHVKDWIFHEIKRRKTGNGRSLEPFLSYVLLDMPSAQSQIKNVSPAMREDSLLAIFTPSVTQIGDCVKIIRTQKLPFVMDRVVELGTGISSGRLWDVRLAQRRSKSNGRNEDVKTQNTTRATNSEIEEATDRDILEASISSHKDVGADAEPDEPVLVCRPKVGERLVGGGFVGIWRRVRNDL